MSLDGSTQHELRHPNEEFAAYLPDFAPEIGKLPAFDLLRTHNPLGWQDVQLLTPNFSAQPEPFSSTVQDAHLISVVLHGTPTLTGVLNGNHRSVRLQPGSIMLIPQYVSAHASWDSPYRLGELMLSPHLLTQSAHMSHDRAAERLELIPNLSLNDPFIYNVCLLLLQEATLNGFLGPLYADTLAQALSVHLLRHYSSSQTIPDAPSRSLTRNQVRRLESYIKERLRERLSLIELASVVGLSTNHFATQFKRSVGLSPHQFVIHCRVERAKELLIRSQLSVAEVATLVGFFDQSHLNRHLKRLLGVTPGDLLAQRNNPKR